MVGFLAIAVGLFSIIPAKSITFQQIPQFQAILLQEWTISSFGSLTKIYLALILTLLT
jgi:hypothetical protein